MKYNSLDLLFARDVHPDYECRCGTPGNYCAAHGTYEPPSRDDEVLSAVAEAARPSRSGNRVIRKRLEN